MRTAIIGGGAAGFFAAIRLKTLMPEMAVEILERQQRVLAKVQVSGGGRCNCTNSFASVTDLGQVYPRGAKLLKRLFRHFGPREAYEWFEKHGVPLVTQEDECVFPAAQDSHAVIDCFLRECKRLGIGIRLGVDGFAEAMPGGKPVYDYVIVCTGGMSPAVRSHFDAEDVVFACPSLFTFNIQDRDLTSLMGTVVRYAQTSIAGTRLRGEGPLLITHWGVSGPAVLKLSAHAARLLAESDYRLPLLVAWAGDMRAEAVRTLLAELAEGQRSKFVVNARPEFIPSRLWEYLVRKAGISTERKWSEVGSRQLNRLVEVLTNDRYDIAGRSHYKEEFVTAGGISLNAIDKSTLEYKRTKGIYFAGEVLDIDGVTGGFNFQAAWTTADAVARAIAADCKKLSGL